MTLLLVVDDDADTRLLLREQFEQNGYFVLTADDGERAMRLLKDHPVIPNAIVLDMVMPKMGGWEFLRLKHEDPKLADIPVILCTGLPVDHARPGCGPDVLLVVTKPYDVSHVLRVLKHVRQTGSFGKFRSDPPPT